MFTRLNRVLRDDGIRLDAPNRRVYPTCTNNRRAQDLTDYGVVSTVGRSTRAKNLSVPRYSDIYIYLDRTDDTFVARYSKSRKEIRRKRVVTCFL